MPVAVATGRCLTRMRLDAGLDPPLSERHVVMGGVRLTDPLEQRMLDDSLIEHVSVDDLRKNSPAIAKQMDRLSQLTDKIYVHIDMDVLDPREVMGHGNKVPDGPSSEQLAAVFETIFSRSSKAAGIGFATIPTKDEGGLSLAAVNRMIVGAVTGLKKRPIALKRDALPFGPPARRAGMKQARSATTMSNRAVAVNVSGSAAPTSNSSPRRNRVSAAAPASPITRPATTGVRPCRVTSQSTSRACAPSAMRTAISRVRSVT